MRVADHDEITTGHARISASGRSMAGVPSRNVDTGFQDHARTASWNATKTD